MNISRNLAVWPLAVAVVVSIGATSYLRAQDQNNGSAYSADFFKALKWRSIGPDRGGRSIASSGSPSRPLEYFFGAVGGGLWKTIDGGQTWNPVTDGQIHSSSVGAVAISESNPDVIYIGMGETCLRGNIMQGDGVYKSSDDGKTWQHIGLEDTQSISRIRINPKNPDIVFVAAFGHPAGPNNERGVFKSADGGKTWKKVLFRNDHTGAIDLSMDRNNPDVLYAAMWDAYRVSWQMSSGGPGSGVFKSTDGGETWKEITRNPGLPTGTIGRTGVSVSSADSNRVYALVEADDGGVFRSNDGGATWIKTNEDRKLRQRAFYYTHIFADPKDKDSVYALNTGMYKSTDGGKTFSTTLRPPHGDNHDLWIDPGDNKRMIESNDGGANVSVSGGATWTHEDFPTAQLYHVATTHEFPYQVCGAQQDNSTVCVQSVSGGRGGGGAGVWPALYDVAGGESGYIAPDPKNPNIIYAGSQGALLTRFDRRTRFTRDVEVYPRFFSGEASKDLKPDRWQWTFPIVFSPLDPTVLYTSSQFLYKTTNEGQSWQAISPDLTKHDPKTLGDSGGPITHDMNGPEVFATIFTIAPSHSESSTIWTGSDDGLVYITRDGGKNWSNITPLGMPGLIRVSLIEASPYKNKAGTAYVAAKNYLQDDRAPYLYKTNDYGKTWQKITHGIRADDYVHAIREDTRRPGLLYAGTEHGIYISYDDGENWQSLSLNLPDTQVSDIVVEDHDLVIATHGRSFYILDNIAPLRQLTREVTQTAALHLYAPDNPVRRIHALSIDYYLKSKAEKVTIDVLDAKGNVIRTYTRSEKAKPASAAGDDEGFRRPPPKVSFDAGLNRFSWDLRYSGSTTFPGMILWGANAEEGPLALPGAYQVRVTADGQSQTQPFRITEDPRANVSPADLQAQFDLAMKVRDAESRANQAVIDARALREQVKERIGKTQVADIQVSGNALNRKFTDVEESIYQVKNRSGQDPLNFAIKINNRIGHLLEVVEGEEDAKPTDQTYKAFTELSAELDVQLAKLKQTEEADLVAFNKQLTAASLEPVSLKPAAASGETK